MMQKYIEFSGKVQTLDDLADYINESNDVSWFFVSRIIEERHWVSDMQNDFGICHNDTQKLVLNDECVAVVQDNQEE